MSKEPLVATIQGDQSAGVNCYPRPRRGSMRSAHLMPSDASLSEPTEANYHGGWPAAIHLDGLSTRRMANGSAATRPGGDSRLLYIPVEGCGRYLSQAGFAGDTSPYGLLDSI